MSGKYLLDTNAVIAILKGEASIATFLETAAEVSISTISLGELFFGAEKSQRVESNLAGIENLAREVPVLAVTADTARHYGRVRNRLKIEGRPIPINDIWISAIALQNGLAVVSSDGHFDQVDGLERVTW